MEATAKEAAETAFVSFKNGLVIWATLAAVLLALLAIFAPLGASLVDKYVETRQQRELKLEEDTKKKLQEEIEKKIEERYETRFKVLSDQVEQLKRTITEKSGRGQAPGGKS
jgi:cell division protein FtsX